MTHDPDALRPDELPPAVWAHLEALVARHYPHDLPPADVLRLGERLAIETGRADEWLAAIAALPPRTRVILETAIAHGRN
jgi:hypothetical protein